MPLTLRNGFWEIVFADIRAEIISLRFDAAGGSGWCPNLLKTSAPRSSHLALTAPTGAQTAYVDASGQWHLSATGGLQGMVGSSATEIEVDGIEYGAVSERWRVRIDGPKLTWTVSQVWREQTKVADALTPGVFFSGQTPWGEPTVFVSWDLGMAKDAFYGTGSILGPECQTKSTRHTRKIAGGWTIAKLLSHACPGGDLRVTTSHHLKKGEILNFSSVLGQSPWCDVDGVRIMEAGETIETSLALETTRAETGVALAVSVTGPLSADAEINRRFFDAYANCGIMADTHDWRLGNQPSGYIAILCRYFHAEMLKYGVPRGSLGPNTTNVHRVLIDEVTRMADHLVKDGSAGPGYQSTTSLDNYTSFLLCMRDVLLLTGDRVLGERLWNGAQRALAAVFRQIDDGGGMIHTTRDEGNDYWDWISRNGHIGYVNIVAWMSLHAAIDVARWLGHAKEIPAIESRADRVRDKYDRDFWSETRGFYADWIDVDGVARFYLYAPPQLMAVAVGLVPPERARRVVDAVVVRRRELGPAWENCFSIQTNLYDAEEFSFMKRRFNADVTRFGETMNGGCLASWNYFWIGALVKVGRVDEALTAWRRFMARCAQTSLVEGCNYWDFKGQPSRTVIPEMLPAEFLSYDLISAEPFLADQGLVASALPRWLLGIELTFDGVKTKSVLPESAHPATATLLHLGREQKIEIPWMPE
ncbi:MAG: hypothetical protein JWM32_275 [Verrucomicrobia bacterium]|nr:hypothetical protein [Verrucomicrobiota bacterium]